MDHAFFQAIKTLHNNHRNRPAQEFHDQVGTLLEVWPVIQHSFESATPEVIQTRLSPGPSIPRAHTGPSIPRTHGEAQANGALVTSKRRGRPRKDDRPNKPASSTASATPANGRKTMGAASATKKAASSTAKAATKAAKGSATKATTKATKKATKKATPMQATKKAAKGASLKPAAVGATSPYTEVQKDTLQTVILRLIRRQGNQAQLKDLRDGVAAQAKDGGDLPFFAHLAPKGIDYHVRGVVEKLLSEKRLHAEQMADRAGRPVLYSIIDSPAAVGAR